MCVMHEGHDVYGEGRAERGSERVKGRILRVN